MAEILDRRLGLAGSTAIGVSAMVGAGLFVVFAPAVDAAGGGLFIALAIAAAVAACNAWSSARLASVYPVSGGTYVYGRERLGPFWGHLAGWSFVAGKVASCAAMALAVGSYAWPHHARLLAIAVVVGVTAINLIGVQKSAGLGIVIVAIVLVIVVVAISLMFAAPAASTPTLPTHFGGTLEAAGLLFFAFAGYARLATLGEEVRRPDSTIPRAIALSVVGVVALYAVVAAALLHVLGPEALAASQRPFVTAVDVAGHHDLRSVVAAAAALSAGGALFSLTLGVSRTVLAMARDRHLPVGLASINGRSRVPRVAEITVCVVVCAVLLAGDLATSVAFSSFCVLVYYAIANASAWTLSSALTSRVLPLLGLIGCLGLAASLPLRTVSVGSVVVGAGALTYAVRRTVSDQTPPTT
jgi:APA family basic amino acid/polyamine antiporter